MKKRSLFFRFRRYMSEIHWHKVQTGYALGLISGVLNGLALMIIMPAFVSLAENKPVFGFSFWAWLGILLVVGLLSIIIDFIGQKTAYLGALGFMHDIHHQVGDKISKLPLGTFKADTAGILSRMVTAEMMNLASVAAHYLYKNFRTIASLAIIAILSWAWDYRLGLLLTLGVPVYLLILNLSKFLLNKGKAMSEPTEEEVASRMVEFAKCQGALRACHASNNYEALSSSLVQADVIGRKSLAWQSLGNLIGGIAKQMLVTISIILIVALAINRSLNAISAIACIGMVLSFSKMLEDVSGNVMGTEERRQQMDRIDSLMDTQELQEVDVSQDFKEIGSIELKDVKFSYDKENVVLNDISFSVKPGEMCALVGPSGSGKTTIEHLIARFYDVDHGSIKVSGVDVRDLTTSELMGQLSMVFQDVYLFNESLLDNIRMGNPAASEAEIQRACDLAGVTEIADRLPDGWKTRVGEGGSSLSGGERQRVSIARALLKKSPIVLLDEATSALDAENEAHIVKSMEELRKNATLLVIAHKLETIQTADKIVVLSEDGRVEQYGMHNDLIKKEGDYKKFWDYRISASQWQLV
ncbi:MAG TPA: ABC transporter ATP-binding protein [Clostridiaceae bacterium]|nr:ABC transporter ATP-binding protein [Clostridiaceae bacterium]